MLSERDRERLLERQARVYEVADVATKPAQWFIGGLKLFILLLVVAGVCIVAPVYAYLHGGSFSSFQFGVGCWTLGFVVMFFGTPWYTFFWGAVIFCSLFWWDIGKDEASRNLFTAVLWVYEGVGLLLVAAKTVHWARRRRQRSESFGGLSVTTADTYHTAREPQQLPAMQKLTPDSALPEHVQEMLHEHLQSMLTEGEAALERQGASQTALQVADVEAMSLPEAMRSTNEMLVAASARMKQLVAISKLWGAHTDRDEAARNVREYLRMQEVVVARMTALLRRIKRENAPYPIAELEQLLNEFRMNSAGLEQMARDKGLV